MKNELVEFIRSEIGKGKNIRLIEMELLKVGWKAEIVRAAMAEVDSKILDEPVMVNQARDEQFLGNIVNKIMEEALTEKEIADTVEVYSAGMGGGIGSEKKVTQFMMLDYLSRVMTGMRRYPIGIISIVLAIIMSIAPTTNIYKSYFPLLKGFQQNFSGLIDKVYPERLEIVINNGRLSTNVSEPYFIDVSQADLALLLGQSNAYNQISKSKIRLVVIDTKAVASDFEKYQALVLLTEDKAIYYGDGDIREQSFLGVGEITINKSKLVDLVQKYVGNNKISGWVDTLFAILPVVIFLGLLINLFMNYLFFGMGVLIMSWANGLPTPFKDCVRYTAAASLFPVLFWELGSLIPQMSGIFSELEPVSNILILAIAYAGIVNLRNNQKRLWSE